MFQYKNNILYPINYDELGYNRTQKKISVEILCCLLRWFESENVSSQKFIYHITQYLRIEDLMNSLIPIKLSFNTCTKNFKFERDRTERMMEVWDLVLR